MPFRWSAAFSPASAATSRGARRRVALRRAARRTRRVGLRRTAASACAFARPKFLLRLRLLPFGSSFMLTLARAPSRVRSRPRLATLALRPHSRPRLICALRSRSRRRLVPWVCVPHSHRPSRRHRRAHSRARARSALGDSAATVAPPPHVGVLHQAKARPRSRRPIRGSAQLPTCAPHSSTCSTVARARFARDAPPPQPPLLVFDSFRRLTRHLQQRRASGLLPSTTARGC